VTNLVWTKKKKTAPFDSTTNSLLDYANCWNDSKVVRDVSEPFKAKLILDSWGRGRSAVRIQWVDADDSKRTFPMFMKDFFELVMNGHSHTITGTWEVVKRGANFGVRLLSAE
jgi:hypothetical protein